LTYCSGLGNNWLQRAQRTLARIHHEEGADSSSGGSSQAGDIEDLVTLEDDAEWEIVPPHPDPRRQGPLYVEARGYLQPAVDFFTRAVQSADADDTTTGDLLAAVRIKSALNLMELTIRRLPSHK
jgi:hypothetical protein